MNLMSSMTLAAFTIFFSATVSADSKPKSEREKIMGEFYAAMRERAPLSDNYFTLELLESKDFCREKREEPLDGDGITEHYSVPRPANQLSQFFMNLAAMDAMPFFRKMVHENKNSFSTITSSTSSAPISVEKSHTRRFLGIPFYSWKTVETKMVTSSSMSVTSGTFNVDIPYVIPNEERLRHRQAIIRHFEPFFDLNLALRGIEFEILYPMLMGQIEKALKASDFECEARQRTKRKSSGMLFKEYEIEMREREERRRQQEHLRERRRERGYYQYLMP